MYSQQDPYSAQQPSGAEAYSQPGSYPPPYPYPPQQQPAAGSYYPQQDPYPYPPQQPGAGLYQGPYPPQYPMMQRNVRARSAMINGLISLGLSLLTLFTLIGFAGLITGTFAIIYGFTGLKVAKQFPNRPGYGQAIAGIVLGFLGWLLVILSFILRGAVGS